MSGAGAEARLQGVLDHTRAYLHTRPDCEAYWPTAEAKPAPGAGRPDLAKTPCQCPLDGLPDLLETASTATQALTDVVIAAADDLHWFQVYTTDQPVGKGKVDRTAVSMLAGPGARFTPQDGQIGFYYLLPGVEYAAHRHAPREIYAILSGTARYWNEASGWDTRGPGDVIHTPEWSWHAMTTVWEPVLILWAWVGAELDRAPRLREEDQGALPEGAFDGIDPARKPEAMA